MLCRIYIYWPQNAPCKIPIFSGYKINEYTVSGDGGEEEPMRNAWFYIWNYNFYYKPQYISYVWYAYIIGCVHWVTHEVYSALPGSTAARPGTSSLPAKDNMWARFHWHPSCLLPLCSPPCQLERLHWLATTVLNGQYHPSQTQQ